MSTRPAGYRTLEEGPPAFEDAVGVLVIDDRDEHAGEEGVVVGWHYGMSGRRLYSVSFGGPLGRYVADQLQSTGGGE